MDFAFAWYSLAFLLTLMMFAGFLIGVIVSGLSRGDEEVLDASEAWRKVNLACTSGGAQHPDACCALVGLKNAGYHIEKSGSNRSGFCYLKIVNPGFKE